MDPTLQDRANRRWYGRASSISGMSGQQGFTDAGERAAYLHVADELRGRPLLDLGIGPGRTVGLLRSLSPDYLGLDYLLAMVDAARARHPEADIRLGDARELSGVPSNHFALVAFSNHGIDSIGHADRQRAMAEAWRVLTPGGVFWFSTLNLAGPAARYRPWRPLPALSPPGAAGLKRRGLQWLRVPLHVLRYRLGLALADAGDGWAVAPFFAGGWHLVAHYTTLHELLQELNKIGFAPDPLVFEDAQGRPVHPGDNLRPVFSFNVLARKPSARLPLQ